MSERISPLAGALPPQSILVNIPRLLSAYYMHRPDISVVTQRVAFGTSGHRGSAFDSAFNEAHILAITQAICLYRQHNGVRGPLFIGIDPHALSEAALASALEVLVANEVDVMVDAQNSYTPTPAISHAILTYNQNRANGHADGIVITPSHNPPEDGGFKYNPPNGGPADVDITSWIEETANNFLANNLNGVLRTPYERALKSPHIHQHDYIAHYIDDLVNVIDINAIKSSGVKIGIDPLGGASIHFWRSIVEKYGLAATIVNDRIDPAFSFMSVDWDGKIRMDCSSRYAMERLIALKDKFDVSFANDTDADRHGIVTRSSGLMNPNHYLSVAIYYLFNHRPNWSRQSAVGKTIVSSGFIDRVSAKIDRKLIEVPVGFKWFVNGLVEGSLGFAGEESAGASFLRMDGSVWTTDKDGIIPGLLAAEITAKTGKDPGALYKDLADDLGEPFYERIDAPATSAQKNRLKKISPEQIDIRTLAGDAIRAKITKSPGNGASFGGIKVITDSCWFAARPSGTEDIMKLYTESFVSKDHLQQVQQEAQACLTRALESDQS
jgi:phosphoglucomutase